MDASLIETGRTYINVDPAHWWPKVEVTSQWESETGPAVAFDIFRVERGRLSVSHSAMPASRFALIFEPMVTTAVELTR